MTRREEIEKAANEFYKGDQVSTFVVVAQWADKTMIEKVEQWLIKSGRGQMISSLHRFLEEE